MQTRDNPLLPFYKEQHWFLANSRILQAWLLHNVPTDIYGPRGKWICRLMKAGANLNLVLLVTRVIGTFDALRWWWKAGVPNRALPKENAIFVGFGAGPEEIMWAKFYEDNNGRAIRLDQTEPSTFGTFHRPALRAMLSEIWYQSAKAYAFLATTKIEPVASYRIDFYTFTAMRLAQYAFYKCWWQNVSSTAIDRVVFISADTPASACLDAGISGVEFHQHGLLRKSVVVQSFPHVKLLTQAELIYFSDLLPKSKIEIVKASKAVTAHQRVLLLASIYETPNIHKIESLLVLQKLVDWAENNSLKVVIRKHPKEKDDFWNTYFPNLEVDRSNDSFENSLLLFKPMLLMTWFSTTLVDALRCNVVPVTINTTDCYHIQDMVVKLKHHCLFWSDDQRLLNELVAGSITVKAVIAGISRTGLEC